MAPAISRRKAVALVLLLRLLRRRRQGRPRQWWVHPDNQRRRTQGDFHNLVAELRLDAERHHHYFRMSAEQMDDLLSRVGADLRRLDTNYREAIEPKQRLAVALRYLATGESFVSLASSYRLGHSTVSVCVHRVCAAIEKHMMSACIPVPTEEAWKAVAQRLWEKWNFPNCLGALGGREEHLRRWRMDRAQAPSLACRLVGAAWSVPPGRCRSAAPPAAQIQSQLGASAAFGAPGAGGNSGPRFVGATIFLPMEAHGGSSRWSTRRVGILRISLDESTWE